MNLFKQVVQYIARNKYIYTFAKRIVFDHRGENNCNIVTNGEMIFIQKNIDKLKCMFDVGANIGEWSNLMISLNSHVKIYAFEPVKDSFEKLQESTHNDNIKIINIALGDKNEKKVFNIYGHCSVLNSLHKRDGLDFDVVDKQEIDVMTLNDFCKQQNINHIDFVKIDVEGGELDVLLGAQNMLIGGIDVIQFEYGGTYIDSKILLKDVFDYLTKLSYEFYKIMPHRLKKVEYSQNLENYQYSNYLAINKNVLHKYNI